MKLRFSKYNKYILSFFIVTLMFGFFSNDSYAVEPEEFLKNPQQELRARNISKNIRCLVCQNQSIDDSSAPLAKDLRVLIRNKVIDGLTDKEIYKFLTDRYGDFILLKPPLKKGTIILWFIPFLFFIFGIVVIYFHEKNSGKNLRKR